MAALCASHEGLVPYPLPAEVGLTEDEELLEQQRRLRDQRTDFEHNAAVRDEPASLVAKLSTKAGDLFGQSRLAVSGAGLDLAQKMKDRQRKEVEGLLAGKYHSSGLEAVEVQGAYRAHSVVPGTIRTAEGHIFVTKHALHFATEGDGSVAVRWADVLSLQKAVSLPVEPNTAPHLIPIPHSSVEWNAMAVYCTRGRLYQFLKFEAPIAATATFSAPFTPKSLERCYLRCDRAWREAADVESLVAERSDYAKQLPCFKQ